MDEPRILSDVFSCRPGLQVLVGRHLSPQPFTARTDTLAGQFSLSCRRAKPKKSPPTNKSLKRKRPMKSSKPCINVVCKRPVSPRPFSANWKPCRSQVAPKQEVPFNPPGNHGAAQTTRNCFRQTRRNRIPRPRRQWRKHPMAKEPLMVPALRPTCTS